MIPEKILHSSAEKVKQMLKNNLLLMMEKISKSLMYSDIPNKSMRYEK